jgi:hypothetical protein
MPPLLFVLFAGALPQELTLAYEQTPGACALDARLPQSIRHYVPRLAIVEARGEGTWTLAVSSRPGEVEIVLSDDRGADQLRRVLRAEPEACAAAADGIGLILERYLSDLGYETGFAELPVIPTATTATIAREVDTATAAEGLAFRLDAGAAYTLEASSNPVRLGPSLDVGLEVLFLRFELGGYLVVLGAEPLTRDGRELGQYRVWSIGGLVRAGGCFPAGPISICGLLGAGVEQVRGSATGDLVFEGIAEREERFITSGALRAEWSYDRLIAYFRAEVVFRPDRVVFTVSGADERYLHGRIDGFFSIGLVF